MMGKPCAITESTLAPRSPDWAKLGNPVFLTICFVLLGLCLRSFHYLRNPSVWHDEAALVLNVLDKDLSSFFGPLLFAEAAPPLFLMVERAVVLCLGDGTFSLRLIPFLASIGSLALVVFSSRRLLSPTAVPWAVLLFACSDSLLWHGCEAKPYAVDVFVATGLAALFLLVQGQSITQQSILFGLLAPGIILLVFPGCFLYGGVLIALLPGVWQTRQPRSWLAYGLLVTVVFASFAFLYLGPIRAQRCGPMEECWQRSFAPWDTPWRVPIWLIGSVGSLFDYCIGPMAQLLILPVFLGSIKLRQRGEGKWLAILLLPMGLALAASLAKAYPFGGSRVVVYAAPGLCLLGAEGIVQVLSWSRRPSVTFCLGLLMTIPTSAGLRSMAMPWKRANCSAAADYVLRRRGADEAVVGNHWEHMYYFRHLGNRHFHLCGESWQVPDRLWIVTIAGTHEDRLEVARAYFPPALWQSLDQKEFEMCTVFRLERRPMTGIASRGDSD